MINNIN